VTACTNCETLIIGKAVANQEGKAVPVAENRIAAKKEGKERYKFHIFNKDASEFTCF
jgi:hypothetical protein